MQLTQARTEAQPRRRHRKAVLSRPPVPLLSVELGIKRMELVYERVNALGSVMQRLGDNSSISLSGGDGSDFSGWWRVECQPIVKRGQCRSPEGCSAPRIEGHSYCTQHRNLYSAQRQVPTGRMLMLSAAPNRLRRRQAPRLDLVDG